MSVSQMSVTHAVKILAYAHACTSMLVSVLKLPLEKVSLTIAPPLLLPESIQKDSVYVSVLVCVWSCVCVCVRTSKR